MEEINLWHWAHRSGGECDPWYEPETEWHVNWKMRFEESCREVVIGPHRADVRATRKAGLSACVIELQHSSIAFGEIRERGTFYGLRFWIIDAIGFKEHLEFGLDRRPNAGATVEASFQWKWFRKSWIASRRWLFLDFGDCLWRITGLDGRGRGNAQSWTYHKFLSLFVESLGNAPVHWRATGTGSLIYRFGRGHVLIIEKQGSY